MKLPSTNAMLFNGAALLIAGASVIFVVRSLIVYDDAPPCTERYAQGTRMSVDRDGQPLAGADLQSRSGGTDWSLLERAKVVKLKSGPAPFAIEFDLTGSKADDRDDSNGREGVGFHWAPRNLGQVGQACLAYSVFLPEGFEYGAGGRLPGLMGIRADKDGNNAELAFSARYAWREDGAGDIHTHIAGLPEGRSLGNDRGGFNFPRGRWIALEQEVVLNQPGQKNGIMRIWVNGALRFEKSNVIVRDPAPAAITGVMSEVVATVKDVSPNAKAQKIWITPFEMRWQ